MPFALALGGVALTVDPEGPCDWPADLLAYRAPGPASAGASLSPVSARLTLHARPGWRNPRLSWESVQSAGVVASPAITSPIGQVETAAAAGGSDPAGRYDRLDLAFDAHGEADFAAQVDGSDGSLEAAVQLALCRRLLPVGGVLVHASAGVDAQGVAWLVPGPSGAGKSTTAREAGYARVLADEMVVVRRVGERFWVWPTPFWSLGRQAPLTFEPAPLGVLARPVKASAPSAEPLDRAAAAAWLMRAVAWYGDAATERADVFALACEIATATPRCVALSFAREGSWLTAVQHPS